jgi:hypothetical protein
MRIKGKLIGAPKPRLCVIERGDEQFVFTINAVLDYSAFDKLCPTPKPPKVMKPGGSVSEDPMNGSYLKKLQDYSEQKTHWLIINALKETEGLIWDKVDEDDPDTWKFYLDELKEGGLTEGEVAHLINQAYLCNSLDESKMDEARERFIRSQEADAQ